MAKPQKQSKQKSTSIYWGIALAALAMIALVVFVLPRLNAPAAEGAWKADISAQEAFQLREDGAFVLDVRTQEEWDDGHIPGATLIPLDQLASRVSEVPADQPVVVYCRSGNRSKSGRDILTAAGLEQVTSMNGGIGAWQAAGYPVE